MFQTEDKAKKSGRFEENDLKAQKKEGEMALVQPNVCDGFERLSQRELLARIFSSPEPEQDGDDSHLSDSSSDAECDDDQECEWKWDTDLCPSTALRHEEREVIFHPDYSCGTAAAKGSKPFGQEGEFFWEVKLTSAVYGTDMMIGVGSKDTDLERYRSSFCSILGRDEESWGLSYFGTFHHNGKSQDYTTKFDRGTTIGVHLDTWNGRLSFLKDNEPLGVAANGLRCKDLYPMVSSTAARTKMRLLRSTSVNFSLQYLCCAAIGQILPNSDAVHALPIPPGVKRYLTEELNWIFKVNQRRDEGRDAKRKRQCTDS